MVSFRIHGGIGTTQTPSCEDVVFWLAALFHDAMASRLHEQDNTRYMALKCARSGT
jgi:hypothetical protein